MFPFKHFYPQYLKCPFRGMGRGIWVEWAGPSKEGEKRFGSLPWAGKVSGYRFALLGGMSPLPQVKGGNCSLTKRLSRAARQTKECWRLGEGSGEKTSSS